MGLIWVWIVQLLQIKEKTENFGKKTYWLLLETRNCFCNIQKMITIPSQYENMKHEITKLR
jgi:hypothetical protein